MKPDRKAEVLALLGVLIDAFPDWVAPEDILKKHKDFEKVRWERVVRALPAEVKSLIKSKPGTGKKLMA